MINQTWIFGKAIRPLFVDWITFCIDYLAPTFQGGRHKWQPSNVDDLLSSMPSWMVKPVVYYNRPRCTY